MEMLQMQRASLDGTTLPMAEFREAESVVSAAGGENGRQAVSPTRECSVRTIVNVLITLVFCAGCSPLPSHDPTRSDAVLSLQTTEEKAETEPASPPNDSDLAKKTQNPVADLISLPFQNNTNFGVFARRVAAFR